MQARPHELTARLSKGLAPIYVVSGDEPLQRDDALSSIRAAARQQGFEERIRLTAGAGFDWLELAQYNDSLSLFSDRRLIELHIPTGKPGDAGSKALVRYCERINEDNTLLVSAPKLDPATRRSKWYKALDKSGVTVQVWPIDAPRLPQWLRDRAARHGLCLSGDAARLLAERVEGNLLAAEQELKKLALLHHRPDSTSGSALGIDIQQIMDAVGASSRYNVFDCVEAALDGNAKRTVKVLNGLREEGLEPVLLVWALGRELRSLIRMKSRLDDGASLEEVLSAERVWDKRKRATSQTLSRTSGATLLGALASLAGADRRVKGAQRGNAWNSLTQTALTIAGVTILTASPYNGRNV